MRSRTAAGGVLGLVLLLGACSDAPAPDEQRSPDDSAEPSAQASSTAGPKTRPGGGLIAEPSDLEGNLAITIKWNATIVVGVPEEGLTTSVFKRTAQLLCPVTSGSEAPYSYFAAIDDPNGDPMAPTGAYQAWWNEDCTGSLTVEDTYHADDPTLAGPEPVVRTTGTRPLSTGDTPLTVETDLNRARTRYLFISPSTDGFQQEAVAGYEGKLVAASAAPIATLDFTLEGPIGDGKGEIAVQGGVVQVDWTFTRGRASP